MLFDTENDPNEFDDLGASPEFSDIRDDLHERLFKWARQPRQRMTVADDTIETTFVQERIAESGILIGYWDEAELEHALRHEWHSRFAAHNPIIGPTLKKLLRKDLKE